MPAHGARTSSSRICRSGSLRLRGAAAAARPLWLPPWLPRSRPRRRRLRRLPPSSSLRLPPWSWRSWFRLSLAVLVRGLVVVPVLAVARFALRLPPWFWRSFWRSSLRGRRCGLSSRSWSRSCSRFWSRLGRRGHGSARRGSRRGRSAPWRFGSSCAARSCSAGLLGLPGVAPAARRSGPSSRLCVGGVAAAAAALLAAAALAAALGGLDGLDEVTLAHPGGLDAEPAGELLELGEQHGVQATLATAGRGCAGGGSSLGGFGHVGFLPPLSAVRRCRQLHW